MGRPIETTRLWLGITLTAPAVTTLLSYANYISSVQSNKWVNHSREVIAMLDSVASTFRDVGSGRPGYPSSREPVHDDIDVGSYEKTHRDIGILKRLTAGSPHRVRLTR